MMKPRLKLLLLAGALPLAAHGVSAGPITIRGPAPLAALVQKWADAYTNAHPQARFRILPCGPDACFTALQTKRTDVAAAARKIKLNETQAYVRLLGQRPTEYRVALEGLAIYVNAENPVSELDVDQLAKIFTGQIKNWQKLGGPDLPITVYGREKTSSAYDLCQEQVLKDEPLVASAQVMPNNPALLRALSRDQGGVGFGGPASGAGAKALRLKQRAGLPGAEPSEEMVLAGAYPVRRWLYLYIDPAQDRGQVAAFLDWVRSDEGQKVVQAGDYYPLPPNWREKPGLGRKAGS
jgi:phosphate transport system substrate-binding protein